MAAIYSSEATNAEVEHSAVVEIQEPIVVIPLKTEVVVTDVAEVPVTVFHDVPPIEGKRPEVAISHEDLDTDFEKLALEEIQKGEVASALVMDLDYRNVKAEAHRCVDEVGEEFVSALHRVWSAFHAIQSSDRR